MSRWAHVIKNPLYSTSLYIYIYISPSFLFFIFIFLLFHLLLFLCLFSRQSKVGYPVILTEPPLNTRYDRIYRSDSVEAAHTQTIMDFSQQS